MSESKRVRIVKREQRADARPKTEARAERPADGERETRNVVSGWVREHQRRTEEFRVNYSKLLGTLGFAAPNLAAAK
ncbi:MAG TPA: hypothetical protein VFX96_13490 [Pyrinomonadaceae bacterium]|nr:hypothetical protein [Pyrinomonadaceae bacterium]